MDWITSINNNHFFVLTVFVPLVSSISPYYSTSTLSSNSPGLPLPGPDIPKESCDSSCYFHKSPLHKEQQYNITLLCGSDGFTYLNFEELNCVRRQCGEDIKLKHYGRCPRVTTLSSSSVLGSTPPPSPPVLQQQKDVNPFNRLDKTFLRFLSQDTSPSQTFIFPEETRAPENLKIPPSKYYWQTARPIYRNGGAKKICLPAECNCQDNQFRPICVSDLVTYGNPCLMECSRECKPNLVKIYDGYCGGRSFQRSSCILNQCDCPDEEYDDDGLQLVHPVCGSDGITYGNRCLLECNKNCKPGLQYSYVGYCEKVAYPE